MDVSKCDIQIVAQGTFVAVDVTALGAGYDRFLGQLGRENAF